MSKYYEKIFDYFQKGIYDRPHLDKLLAANAITAEEHEQILVSVKPVKDTETEEE